MVSLRRQAPPRRTTMGARQAVLPIPSKPSGPTQLLSYKQNASVSPLFATLTSRPQLAENTAALSPLLATLAASAPVTLVFATLTKTAGVSTLLFPFWNSPLAALHPSLECGSSAAASRSTTPSFHRNILRLPTNTRLCPFFSTLCALFCNQEEGTEGTTGRR